jgi:hypothetical protein
MSQTSTEFDQVLSQAEKMVEADLFFYSMSVAYYVVSVKYHYLPEVPDGPDGSYTDEQWHRSLHLNKDKTWQPNDIALIVANIAPVGTPNPLLI